MTSPWTPAIARGRPATPGGPGVGWMIGMSCWMLPLFLFVGSGAWISFLIIAIVIRRRSWFVFAAIYGVLSFALFFSPDSVEKTVALGGLQIISMIHALIINQHWLNLTWGRRERGQRIAGPVAAGARSAGASADRDSVRSAPQPAATAAEVPDAAAGLLSQPGTSRSDYLAGPAATRAPAGPPLDVNTATERELAELPHITKERAAAIVKARKRHAFSSAQNLADVVGLQPHELVALRTRLTFAPQRRPKKFTGRRLDL